MAPSSPQTDPSSARGPSAPEGPGRRPGAPIVPGADLFRRTDEDLLGRYRDTRQAKVFDELVRRYAGELHRYLARYLANDVLQNTFLQVQAKCRLYQDGRPARPRLYAIATHQAVDALRRAGRRAAVSLDQRAGVGEEVEPGALVDLLIGEEPGPLDELEEAERQQWVRDSVARLPEVLGEEIQKGCF